MVKKPNKWPEIGEKIVGTIIKINPFSAVVKFEEYEGREGTIQISEVARKWIRDIRDFIKVGDRTVFLVLNVDQKMNYIALSIKRLKDRDIDERMKEYKREQKAEKLLVILAKDSKFTLDKIYEEVGFKLQDSFGEMFKAFKMSMTPEGYNILIKKGISEKWAKKIKEIAETNMEIKELTLKANLKISFVTGDGIESIKKVLTKYAKSGIEIKYVSAPDYSVGINTKDVKGGQKILKELLENISGDIIKAGGESSFEMV